MPGKTRGEEVEFGVWRSGGSGLAVEYSLQVLEELRSLAVDGFQKIAHGGIENGALLLGYLVDGVVRICEWREIHCEHARGPGFVLSENDLAGVAFLIERVARDPLLDGLAPVGWFHTHTRSSLFLSEEDIAIHNRFFPDAWQTALVMAVGKDHSVTAGFFVRDADGALDGGATTGEFSVKPNPAVSLLPRRRTAEVSKPAATAPQPPVTTVPRERRRSQARPLGFHTESPATLPAPVPQTPVPQAVPAPRAVPVPQPYLPAPRELIEEPARAPSKWGALAVIAAVLALAAAGYLTRSRWWPAAQEAIAMRVEETGSQLVIRWDHDSPAVRRAERAVLAITDGANRTQLELSAEETRRGSVTYLRAADDVEVRFTLYEGGRAGLQEFARFVGNPGADQPPTRTLDELRDERDRLQAELDREKARGARLVDDVRRLEQRLKQDPRADGANARK